MIACVLFALGGCWCAIGERLLGAITFAIVLLVSAGGINCFIANAISAFTQPYLNHFCLHPFQSIDVAQ